MAIEVTLPTLHGGQVQAFRQRTLRNAIRCGRRWGKSVYGTTLSGDGAIKGWPIGYFAPTYKLLREIYRDTYTMLEPIVASSSKTEGVISTRTGGRIDFWSLEDENAGRSRKYKRVIVDEGAFTGANMRDIWEKAIEPTLLDYSGSCDVLSNTNGDDPENFFWQICNLPDMGFKEFYAPSESNPTIPERLPNETEAEWLTRRRKIFDDLRAKKPPLVYAQEYEAKFVNWAGEAFFSIDKWMVDGRPVPYPDRCDSVFAVLDTAVKAGQEHDGTGVLYFATSQYHGHPLTLLDYDLVQIEGASLETWLPLVYQNLERLARVCGARSGSIGAFIEDKGSGTILIQQAQGKGLPAHAIDSKVTAMGKDERAIAVSGYHYQGLCKISQHCFDKLVTFKGLTRNHLVSQVTSFRVGDKDAAKRADDLLDTYTSGLSLALGNRDGY